MILSGYGIELSVVTEDKIEKIRGWRNHPEIADVMLDKNKISSEEQKAWFQSLKEKQHCLYLLISYKNEDIGMIYAQVGENLSLTMAKSISPGLYIAPDCKYKNSVLAFCPSLVFIDYLFKQGTCEELVAQVFEFNESAIRYNKMLGYQVAEVDEQGLLKMRLDRSNFEFAKKELSKILRF